MNDDKVLGQGKWLSLVERKFRDTTGKAGTWEFATRPNGTRTVSLFAIKRDGIPTIILVKQFRVPLAGFVIEFPAGLIDDGETAAEAAVRELAEETGYLGTVVGTGPFTYNSPGLTDECVAFVHLDIIGRGEQSLSTDESIEVIEVPLDHLIDALRSFDADGTKVDAKLWFVAEALRLANPTTAIER